MTARRPAPHARAVQLFCKSCGSPVPAADVHLERLVAKCRRCNAVFAFGAHLGRAAPAPRRRPPLPRGLRVESGEPPLPAEGGYRTAAVRERGPLVITRRWFRPLHLFLLVFAMVWDGFLVSWYAAVARTGGSIEMLFPLLHVAAGVAVTYAAVTGLVNRTVLRVEGGKLSVRHGPLPWIGNVEIETARLRQLYVRRRMHHTKNGTYYTWSVQADTDDFETITLLARLHDREQAEYIEWAVEAHLGIEDDPGCVFAD